MVTRLEIFVNPKLYSLDLSDLNRNAFNHCAVGVVGFEKSLRNVKFIPTRKPSISQTYVVSSEIFSRGAFI